MESTGRVNVRKIMVKAMQETRVVKRYSALKVLKLGKFKQVAKEPVLAWLVRLWDTGGWDPSDCCGDRKTE